ncbi:hypothetical protein ACXX82_00425 [Glaciimonas sp. GNP009]
MLENKPELLCRLVVKQQSNGVRICDKEVKRALIEACRTQDVSIAGLALKFGLNANLVHK